MGRRVLNGTDSNRLVERRIQRSATREGSPAEAAVTFVHHPVPTMEAESPKTALGLPPDERARMVPLPLDGH